MSKRGDNIHKRKDGRWEGRFKKGRKPDGTIIYGSLYGKTYREVKSKLSELPKIEQNLRLPQNHERTFGEVLSLWMEHNRIRLKGGTINKYQNLIDTHIMPELGRVKLSELDSTMINTFLTKKMTSGRVDHKGGLSASYVRSIMLVISSSIKYAVEVQMCLPLKTPICKPSTTKKDLPVLSRDEQKHLEQYLLTDLDNTKAGILISLHTGLRIGEICALTWDDVDLQNHIIRVRHTVARVKNSDARFGSSSCLILDTPKTAASTRDIPISSALLPILTIINNQASSKFVVSNSETFLSPRTFEYRYHRLLEESGIASINYHALRHTFATRCIEAGVDVKSLSEMLGHANVGVTLNTYVHSSMKLKRTQLEKLITFSA